MFLKCAARAWTVLCAWGHGFWDESGAYNCPQGFGLADLMIAHPRLMHARII